MQGDLGAFWLAPISQAYVVWAKVVWWYNSTSIS